MQIWFANQITSSYSSSYQRSSISASVNGRENVTPARTAFRLFV